MCVSGGPTEPFPRDTASYNPYSSFSHWENVTQESPQEDAEKESEVV